MKVYRVLTEEDGKTIKAPGISETERKRCEFRYAALTIDQVWEAIKFLRDDPEREVIAVHEEHPAITILDVSPAAKEKK